MSIFDFPLKCLVLIITACRVENLTMHAGYMSMLCRNGREQWDVYCIASEQTRNLEQAAIGNAFELLIIVRLKYYFLIVQWLRVLVSERNAVPETCSIHLNSSLCSNFTFNLNITYEYVPI